MVNERLTAWFPLLIFVVLAAVTFWLNQKIQLPDAVRDGSQRHDPDFIMDDFSSTQMREDGEVQYSLSAKQMSHYPDDGSTQLTSPILIYSEKSRAPLRIVANRALLSRDGESVYFRGNVFLSRPPQGRQGKLTMATEFLHVTPKENIGKTDRFVSIKQPGTVVTAVGMEFNGASRIIKLLSKVNSRYERSPS